MGAHNLGERHMLKRSFFLVLSLMFAGLFAAQAAAPEHFGAVLSKHTQPSGAGNGDPCDISSHKINCSYVLMQAFKCEFGSCTNGHLAPADGTINKISLVTCAAGTFTLQIAKANAKTNKAQVISTGPLINYVADTHHCDGNTYLVQSFTVNVPIQKGDYLAVEADEIGFVNCSGGGANMLLFHPPLADGAALRKANGRDGCLMMLEAFYAPPPTRPSFAPWHP
jgi:hypothetical protein